MPLNHSDLSPEEFIFLERNLLSSLPETYSSS